MTCLERSLRALPVSTTRRFRLSSRFTPIIQVQAPTSNLPWFTDTETATDAEGLSSILSYHVPTHTVVSEAHQETQLEKKAIFVCV